MVDYNVSFDDIDDVAKAALRHRLALNFDALSENIVADTIIAALQEALNGRKNCLMVIFSKLETDQPLE